MKNISVIIFFLLASSSLSTSQVKTETPHGGRIKASGYYRVEVVECYEYMEIYLYEPGMLPVMNHGISGSVDFHYPGGVCLSSPLYPYGVDGFTAEIRQQCYSSCVVMLSGQGMGVSVLFSGSDENNQDCSQPGAGQAKN